MAMEKDTKPPATGESPPHVPGDAEARRRRSRSIALALVLGALVVLFYVVTIAKMGPQVLQRPM